MSVPPKELKKFSLYGNTGTEYFVDELFTVWLLIFQKHDCLYKMLKKHKLREKQEVFLALLEKAIPIFRISLKVILLTTFLVILRNRSHAKPPKKFWWKFRNWTYKHLCIPTNQILQSSLVLLPAISRKTNTRLGMSFYLGKAPILLFTLFSFSQLIYEDLKGVRGNCRQCPLLFVWEVNPNRMIFLVCFDCGLS